MSFLPSVECGKFKLKKAFQRGKILACTKKSKICATSTRGGVLEDTFWSPWSWPQSLKSSKIALSSARGISFRLEDSTISWTVKILLKNPRNFAENLRRPFSVFLTRRSPEKIFLSFSPEKKFLRPFFCDRLREFFDDLLFCGERLRLCSWSLALASRGSVLDLGLEIFLSPWPRALCPRLHLCLLLSSWLKRC